MAHYGVLPAFLLLWGCSDPITTPDPLLLSAAMAYRSYGPVDEDPRSAMLDCEPPSPPKPRLSDSGDGYTHGRKLYYLFAKNRGDYLNAKKQAQSDGQIIVKESWIPGKERKKGPIFMMMKSQGDWVYATANPDGTMLTSSGKVAVCMKCHEGAPHDKLFGIHADEEDR
jgi:hypothetical protein